MKKPLLSIIVPIYNAEKYLPIFMINLLKAGVDDAEIILVDDGSTDRSIELIAGYAEKYPFVKAVRQSNSGPSAARNNGISHADGRYLTFMDSDDYIDPDAFAGLSDRLERYDAQLWISDFRRVADDGTVLSKVYQIRKTGEPIPGIEYMDEFLAAPDCVWNVWRCVFRRDFLDENGLRFLEGYNCAEDLEFMVRALSKVDRPVFWHNPYYFYRVNYGSTLTRLYTLKRVRDFTDMMLAAFNTVETCGRAYAERLKSKLAYEYILNIAVCMQVPKSERTAALECYRRTWHVLDNVNSHAARLIKTFVRVFGLRFTAFGLNLMKLLKKLLRRLIVRKPK